MARDRDLQALIDKAAQAERSRQRAEQQGQLAEQDASASREVSRAARDRVGVTTFMNVRRTTDYWFWGVLGMVGVVTAILSYQERWDGWVLPVALGAVGLFLVRTVFWVAGLARDYRAFVAFPQGRAFPVVGWPELLAAMENDTQNWKERCSVAIRAAPTSDVAVLGATLELFLERSRRHFYAPSEFGGAPKDLRQRWTRGALVASGSANLGVAYEIYRFVVELEALAPRVGGVEGVTITSVDHVASYTNDDWKARQGILD